MHIRQNQFQSNTTSVRRSSSNRQQESAHPSAARWQLYIGFNYGIGLNWAVLGRVGLYRLRFDWYALHWFWFGLNWFELDWSGLTWIGLDRLALTWCGLDWIGSGWIGCLAGNRLEQKNTNVSLFRPVADIDFNICVLFYTRVWQPIQFCWEASLSCEQMLLHGYGKSACTQHCYHYCLIQIR